MSGIFKIGGHVIVPSHGLGKLVNKLTKKIGENDIELLEIFFEQENLKVMIPFTKAKKMGIRTPISKSDMEKIFDIIKEDSRGMRVIWSKRSREYNKKILTGDLFAIAEVVRDLFRNTNNPNRSYSERVIFEKALQRLVAEIAVVNGMTDTETEEKVLDILSKYHETYQDTVSEEFVEVDEEFDSEPEQLPQGI
jgi:CarD family transcriptional regulator